MENSSSSSSSSSSSPSAAGQQDEEGVPVSSLPTAQQELPSPEQQPAQDSPLTDNQYSAQEIQSTSSAPPFSEQMREWLRLSAGTGLRRTTEEQAISAPTSILPRGSALPVRNSGLANVSRTRTAAPLSRAMDYGTRTSSNLALRLRNYPSAIGPSNPSASSPPEQRGRATTRPKEGSEEARRWVPAGRCPSCEHIITSAHYERSMEREDRLNTISIRICPICKEELNCPKLTPCGHLFCAECLRRWFDNGHDRVDRKRGCPSYGGPLSEGGEMGSTVIGRLYRGPRRGSFGDRTIRPKDLIRLPENKDASGERHASNHRKATSIKPTTTKKTPLTNSPRPATPSPPNPTDETLPRNTSPAQRSARTRANNLAIHNFRDSIKLHKHLMEAATSARTRRSVKPDTAGCPAWDQTVQRHARQVARTEETLAQKEKENEELQAMTREQFRV